MTKIEMRKTAKDVFDRHKNVDKVFVTSDGQAFTDEAHAKNHATKNRSGKELALESFLRGEVDTPPSPAPAPKGTKDKKTAVALTDKKTDAKKPVTTVAKTPAVTEVTAATAPAEELELNPA